MCSVQQKCLYCLNVKNRESITDNLMEFLSDDFFRRIMHSKSPVVNLAERHETLFINKWVAVCKSVEANVI